MITPDAGFLLPPEKTPDVGFPLPPGKTPRAASRAQAQRLCAQVGRPAAAG